MPLLEVLPVKKSLDPAVPRRLVYLDQNIVSNIAKMRLGRRMATDALHEATERLYVAVQSAVRDRRDAICIESMFHRTESSGLVVMASEDRRSDAYKLFHEISEFITYYSYTTHLAPCFELLEVQAVMAVAHRLGLKDVNERDYNWRAALSRDPHSSHGRDGRVVEFGGHEFVLGAEWTPRTVRESPWAQDVTRMRANDEFPDFDTTMERAKREQRASAIKENEVVSWAGRWGHAAFNEMPRGSVNEFIRSDELFDLPVLYVSRFLYAHVLSERTRAFKDSDPNDIDILSAAIPYSDIVITDRYMAEAAVRRGLDGAFNTVILPATAEGLHKAADILTAT